MKSFTEFRQDIESINKALRESPQRLKGNAPFEEVSFTMLRSISANGIKRDFEMAFENFIEIDTQQFDLYVSKDHYFYVLGHFYKDTKTETRFAVIFDLSFEIKKISSKQKQLQGKKAIVISTVHTAKDYRSNKIAQKFYQEILTEYVIISDQLQYEGAVNLWKRLIANNVVYTYDILEDKIISKVSENTPESHIWSDDASKRRIRLPMVSNLDHHNPKTLKLFLKSLLI